MWLCIVDITTMIVEWLEEGLPRSGYHENHEKNERRRQHRYWRQKHTEFLNEEMMKYPRRRPEDSNAVLSRQWLEKHLGFPPMEVMLK